MTSTTSTLGSWVRLDGVGVLASVACTLHCLLAPVIVLAAPAAGGWWANPLSHVLIAGLALPVAAVALCRGFAWPGRRRVLALGAFGAALVTLAAILPWLAPEASASTSAADSCGSCCPLPEVDDATGDWSLRFPPASIVSLAGGLALIAAHVGNRYCCRACRGC